jgi:hypothetical protein
MVAPSEVLSRAPYIGVRCPVANSIACDRVALAVWLKHPAAKVSATIAGARLSLSPRSEIAYPGDGPDRAFAGDLQPAEIVSRLHVRPVEGNVISTKHGKAHVGSRRRMWFGDGSTPPTRVRLTIHEPSGRTVVTSLRVPLGTGWG